MLMRLCFFLVLHVFCFNFNQRYAIKYAIAQMHFIICTILNAHFELGFELLKSI